MGSSFEIVHVTEGPLKKIEKAARVCYRTEDSIGPGTAEKMVAMLCRREHWAMIEFADMHVIFEGVSRGFTHEMVRHRLVSYGQESTRYVNYKKKGGFGFTYPPGFDKTAVYSLPGGGHMTGESAVNLLGEFYTAMIEAGRPPQDARQFLPIGIHSKINVKANLTEWRHIFRMRTNEKAHWEIRTVMCRLLKEVKLRVPVVFDDFDISGDVSWAQQLPPGSVESWRSGA